MNPELQNILAQARSVPTELSTEEVRAMFDTIVPQPEQAESNNHKLTPNQIKLIIMSLTTLSLSLVIYFFGFANNINSRTTSVIAPLQSSNQSEIKFQRELNDLDYFINQNYTKQERRARTAEIESLSLLTKGTNQSISIPERDIPSVDMKKPEFEDTQDQAQDNKMKYYSNYGILRYHEVTSDPLPELSSRTMRRMKRKLYKELVNDQLIRAKGIPVTIELHKDQITINNQVLNNELEIKYYQITHKAGTGPNRKIEMHSTYIKIGDFTSVGFKGSGLGTFEMEGPLELTAPNAPEDPWNILWKEERNALNQFCENLLDQMEHIPGKNPLFSVNIKDSEKLRSLSQSLRNALIEDEYITDPEDFILITHQKDKMTINGKTLDDNQRMSYVDLLATCKVKAAPNRMVRMSKHTISIGDFTPQEFTGTLANYED